MNRFTQTSHPNVPYALGRLFAVYEAAQGKANPGINATIKDKFFNSAAATPSHIFPVLNDLYQKHLRKIDGGLKVYYERLVAELSEIIGEEYPTRLSLPERGAFQLGYYHQQQKRYEKKDICLRVYSTASKRTSPSSPIFSVIAV